MSLSKRIKSVIGAAAVATLAISTPANAGPVILGGDDLTDHGSRSGGLTPANLLGWLYMEKAIADLNANQTRGGTISDTIAALGSAANPTFDTKNAGGAIGSVADVLGLSVLYVNGAADLGTFFTDLAGGKVNPAILWIAGDGAGNDLVSTEITVINNNAAAIEGFVTSGGGLMSHGDDDVYGWLSTLIPGIGVPSGCTRSGATLTLAGQAAFPGLSNTDITSGPCHNNFTGNLGGLAVLALDGASTPRNMIIGGDVTSEGGGFAGVPEPGTLALLGLGLAGLGFARRKMGS